MGTIRDKRIAIQTLPIRQGALEYNNVLYLVKMTETLYPHLARLLVLACMILGGANLCN